MDFGVCKILTILYLVSCANCCVRKPPGYLHHQTRNPGDNGYSITVQKTKSYLETDKYVPGTAYTSKYLLLYIIYLIVNWYIFRLFELVLMDMQIPLYETNELIDTEQYTKDLTYNLCRLIWLFHLIVFKEINLCSIRMILCFS